MPGKWKVNYLQFACAAAWLDFEKLPNLAERGQTSVAGSNINKSKIRKSGH
jgi:uncharacterized iron-regulated protein